MAIITRPVWPSEMLGIRQGDKSVSPGQSKSLLEHTRYVYQFDPPKHQLVWFEALSDLSIRELLLVCPPKTGKTPSVADYLTWRIGKNPSHHVLYCSNTAKQALKPSIAIRDTIAYNLRFRSWYDVQPDTSKGWSGTTWYVKRPNESDKDPTLEALGMFGPALGATVDEILLDDVADQENMATAYQREKAMEWINKTLFSRGVPDCRKVCICTRWHEKDPAAEFEAKAWKVIHMPAIWPDGSLLYPEYWTHEALAATRKTMGARDFELMFQGRVLPEGGSIFKHEWWRYWKPDDPPSTTMVVQVWDTAYREKQKADYSACTTWGVSQNQFCLLDAWRGKVELPDLERVVVSNAAQHKPHLILIEDAASGISLIQELQRFTKLPVVAVKVDHDKVTRAHSATPLVESGRVSLPWEAPWRRDFEYECEVFPNGEHDDWLDTLTMFLNWARVNVPDSPLDIQQVKKESLWRET